MAIELDHTIVNVRDKRESATFLAELFGLPEPQPFGAYFLTVTLANGVTLDFCDDDRPIDPQHYAFLVGDAEFDAIFAKIRARGMPYWADPARKTPGEINHHDGGRGVYFLDPSGHFLEIITVPYGGRPRHRAH
jgi:catechol 2,3-dioxygenase-like lactoylglutathione lyase family enzyme